MLSLDPFALDRAIAETARRYSRFLEAVAEGRGEDHAFEALPAAISRTTLEQLRAHAATDPFAAAAARWTAHLLVEHAAVRERVAAGRAYRVDLHPLEGPERGQWTVSRLIDKVLADGPRRAGFLTALTESGEELGARRSALFERLDESRRGFGVDAVPLASAELENAGSAFLRASDDAWGELEITSFADVVDLGLGSDVPGAFPAALTPRKLGDWFREGRLLDGLSPEVGRLPRLLGASSVLRSLAAFGAALHDAGAGSRRPFVVARDPAGTRSRTFAALFALVPLHASFAERRLELGRGRFEGYHRALARVLLIASRLSVLRARLARAGRDGASAYRRCFREELPAALGFELSPRLAYVVLSDEHGESALAALFAAAHKDRLLTERHDEDWFRNPRCLDELRGEIESPPEHTPSLEALEAGPAVLARTVLAAS